MLSRISPWLLGVAFLGLAVGAMVMPLSSDSTPYSFLFDRSEAKNDQQRFLNNVVADSGVPKESCSPSFPSSARSRSSSPSPSSWPASRASPSPRSSSCASPSASGRT